MAESVCVIPGDGVGQEVIPAALAVLLSIAWKMIERHQIRRVFVNPGRKIVRPDRERRHIGPER